MPRYFIGVVHLAHAKIAQENGFCAFSHGKEAPLRKLAVGDRFVLYSPKDCLDGAPYQAFTALGTVTGDAPVFGPFPTMGVEAWQRAASYVPVRHVPVRPMLDDLSFVTNPTHWGMAFRRSFFEIGAADFEIIAGALTAQ